MTSPFQPAQGDTRAKAGPAFWGLAECGNPSCDSDLRPVKMRTETIERMSPDLPGVVLTSNDYDQVLDDADLTCPECGRACMILREPPRVIPSYGYGS